MEELKVNKLKQIRKAKTEKIEKEKVKKKIGRASCRERV